MVMNRAVGTLDNFPSIHQVKEIADWFQANKPNRERQSKIFPKDCDDCMGDGLVFLQDEDGGKYVFSCETCENGKMQAQLAIEAAEKTNEKNNHAPKVSIGYEIGFMRTR